MNELKARIAAEVRNEHLINRRKSQDEGACGDPRAVDPDTFDSWVEELRWFDGSDQKFLDEEIAASGAIASIHEHMYLVDLWLSDFPRETRLPLHDSWESFRQWTTRSIVADDGWTVIPSGPFSGRIDRVEFHAAMCARYDVTMRAGLLGELRSEYELRRDNT